jgi:hypothetical protein
MENEAPPGETPQELTRKERKVLRRQEKLEKKDHLARQKTTRRIVSAGLTVLAIVGVVLLGYWYVKKQPPVNEEDIISRTGLHWHPRLTIVIQGKEQAIPANIGIGARHEEIHTHEADGIVHMEMEGLVTKDETRLGEFFRIWGKTFTAQCVFEFCTGSEGALKFLVNGEPNTEFENYRMKDGDKIEIRYE